MKGYLAAEPIFYFFKRMGVYDFKDRRNHEKPGFFFFEIREI